MAEPYNAEERESIIAMVPAPTEVVRAQCAVYGIDEFERALMVRSVHTNQALSNIFISMERCAELFDEVIFEPLPELLGWSDA
jgi:hypothetical protein